MDFFRKKVLAVFLLIFISCSAITPEVLVEGQGFLYSTSTHLARLGDNFNRQEVTVTIDYFLTLQPIAVFGDGTPLGKDEIVGFVIRGQVAECEGCVDSDEKVDVELGASIFTVASGVPVYTLLKLSKTPVE